MFHDVIGHQDVKTLLQKYINDHKTPHALLFWGEDGIGKKKMAMEFALGLLCPDINDKQFELTKKRIYSGNHPDVVVLSREAGKEDILVGQIEEINQNAFLMAEKKGGKRVFILEDVDRLNVSAANRFLKTLEEPPSDVVFILITSHKGGVLPTIFSRCQTVYFKPLSALEVEKIMEGILTEESMGFATLLAKLSLGRPGRALYLEENQCLEVSSFLENCFLSFRRIPHIQLRKHLENFCDQFTVSGEEKPSKLALQRRGFRFYMEMMLLFFRDLIAQQLATGGRCQIWNFQQDKISSLDSRQLLRIISLLENYTSYIKGNAYIQLAQDTFCIQVCQIWNESLEVA